MIRRPPRSPLFPSPTLFRSRAGHRLFRFRLPPICRQGASARRRLLSEPDGAACYDQAQQRFPHASGVPKGSHVIRSEEHTSELQSRLHLVCRLLLEKKKIEQGADSIGGFDITLVANHTIIKPADARLAGSILSGGTVLAKRIGGVLKTGAACRPSDSLDTIELAAIDPPGQVTYAPTTGLLFTAVYNVTGTIGTPIDFQTGS